MALKLAFLIVLGAATSVGLLVVRQQRLQAVHDMARAIERADRLDRAFWRTRIELARALSPERTKEMLALCGPTDPIPVCWADPTTDLSDDSLDSWSSSAPGDLTP